jgi:methyl-coenzyme M reductase subunit D
MGLEVLVGRITLELAGKEIMEEIDAICKETLPCGYDIREGRFIQTRQTVSDYAKRGPAADPALYGLYDPKSKIESQVNLLRTRDKE